MDTMWLDRSKRHTGKGRIPMTEEHQETLSQEVLKEKINDAKKFIEENRPIVKEYYDKVNLLKSIGINPYEK